MIYTPLYIKTEYSLMQSLIKIKDLVDFAVKNHLKALTLTDDNMCGAMEFYKLCTKNNIKPIIGLDVNIDDHNIILYAKNYEGYKNLIKISTIISENRLNYEILKKYSSNLICILPFKDKDLYESLNYEEKFIGFENIEEMNLLNENKIYLKSINCLEKQDKIYLKYLNAIRDNLVIEQVKDNNSDSYLYLEQELPYDLTNNYKIYDLCNIEMQFKKSLIPKYQVENYTSFEYLKYLCKEGLKKRFGDTVGSKYIERLKYELDVINEMNFCDYFLIVWDYVKYAKENNILVGPGRGSSAGSLVSYCLDIIEIDPLKYNLLFERFLNKNRVTMPDIDIDFDGLRKEEVIDYCKDKYGLKHVCNIITFSSLTAKQVIKDIGKVLDLPNELVDYFSKMFKPKMTLMENYNTTIRIRNHLEKNKELKELFRIALKLEDLKRHISVHASGVVIASNNLDEIIPLVNYKGDYLTGYQAEYLEELGLIKMDFLSLKTLTTIDEIVRDIKDIDYDNIPLNDDLTIDIFKNGNTLGIFQFESSGMINFLKNFKPSNFEEIYNVIALYRPGPMDNINTFIRRRNRREKVNYYSESLMPILKSTYGIMVYQEQIMQTASIMAGYTLGEADILRRAMSKKKEDVLINEKNKFITRSIERGYDKDVANKVYDVILKFAEYGFAKAHAVAYSVISYKMAYIKAHYPLHFMKVMLNRVIGSSNDTKEYIISCKENNISILNPNINISTNSYEIVDNKLLYPLINIKNVSILASNNIINSRKDGFKDIFDFIEKVDKKIVNKNTIENLIYVGCFDDLGYNRKTLIENLDIIINYADLLEDLGKEFVEKPEINIYEEYSNKELINFEYQALGFYLNIHPVNEYRKKYQKPITINSISNYLNKNIEVIARIESLKEVRTKKQELVCFMKIGDELSSIDSPIFSEQYKEIEEIKEGDIVLIRGKANRRGGKDQLIVNDIKVINSNY